METLLLETSRLKNTCYHGLVSSLENASGIPKMHPNVILLKIRATLCVRIFSSSHRTLMCLHHSLRSSMLSFHLFRSSWSFSSQGLPETALLSQFFGSLDMVRDLPECVRHDRLRSLCLPAFTQVLYRSFHRLSVGILFLLR